jgi:hypothetical protein
VPRVFLIGLGFHAGGFALRQFTINKHQQIVNEQRRNALDTFGCRSAIRSIDLRLNRS